ncbi:MAG: hypothetical protein EOM17_16110, partial [Synergistales bacterium]|nr:hypothetical protein [Synergistales bacterium]
MIIPQALQKLIDGAERQTRIFKSGPASQMYLAQALIEKGHNVVLVLPPSADLPLYDSLARLFAPEDRNLPFWERRWLRFPHYTV